MSQQSSQDSRSFSEWVSWVWAEGLARRVIIEKGDHRPVDLPLTIVLVGGVLAPWLLAIGVIVAVLMSYSLRVERKGGEEVAESAEPAAEPAPQPAPAAPTPLASSEPQPGEDDDLEPGPGPDAELDEGR